MFDCLVKSPTPLAQTFINHLGPWVSSNGSSHYGGLEAMQQVFARVEAYSSPWSKVFLGVPDLLRAEQLFYQGNDCEAEALFAHVFGQASQYGQYEAVHRALFYLERIAVSQGDRAKAEKILKELEHLLSCDDYTLRFIAYDIAASWYQYAIRQPEMMSDWIKTKFEPYSHAYYIQNFGNQIRARYYFLTEDYLPVLAYIDEMKRRESVLFGRVEMLALEACIRYKQKEKAKAFDALRAAYEDALPNRIVMPFAELGKDMLSLASAALRDPACQIPVEWLKDIKRRSAIYAKYQQSIIFYYQQDKTQGKELSPREKEVLRDLYDGLSRSEIAVKQGLSINTVKMVIANIYTKLNAKSLADLIRIATEQKLL
jgi:LuxR family maltose regulon positive regulatory protein